MIITAMQHQRWAPYLLGIGYQIVSHIRSHSVKLHRESAHTWSPASCEPPRQGPVLFEETPPIPFYLRNSQRWPKTLPENRLEHFGELIAHVVGKRKGIGAQNGSVILLT